MDDTRRSFLRVSAFVSAVSLIMVTGCTRTHSVPRNPTAKCANGWRVLHTSDGWTPYAMDGPTPDDVWITARTDSGPVVQHLSHGRLVSTTIPTAPPRARYDILLDIAALSSLSLYAVGISFPHGSEANSDPLLLHWDGSSWARLSTPRPNAKRVGLTSIHAIATDDIWVVGWYGDRRGGAIEHRPLIEHWDGKTWTVTPPVDIPLAEADLYAVVGTGQDDVWAAGAVGYYNEPVLFHWNGDNWSRWRRIAGGGNITSLAAISPSDIWGVGMGFTALSSTQTPLIVHWDGSNWDVATTPVQRGTELQLHSVAAVSPNDVWAVGELNDHRALHPLVEHWDGKRWSIVSNPDPGYHGLVGEGMDRPPASNSLAGVHAWKDGTVMISGSYTVNQQGDLRGVLEEPCG